MPIKWRLKGFCRLAMPKSVKLSTNETRIGRAMKTRKITVHGKAKSQPARFCCSLLALRGPGGALSAACACGGARVVPALLIVHSLYTSFVCFAYAAAHAKHTKLVLQLVVAV